MREQTVRLLRGDCVALMGDLAEESIDAIVTDPPYDLTAVSRGGSPRQFVDNPYGRSRVGTDRGGFMGKTWDATGVAFRTETWRAALRVLKPGAHLLAFGGTRTYHRMACAIEDAGFEIRDSIVWLYGSGFPKSLNVGRAIGDRGLEPGDWSGWGTALKPGHEPIVLARKPLASGSVADNVLRHRTGALNIDGSRVHFAGAGDEAETKSKNRHVAFGSGARENRVFGPDRRARLDYEAPGRWPGNVLLTHSPDCLSDGKDGCARGCPIAELDRQSGPTRSRAGRPRASAAPGQGYGMTHTGAEYADQGGASRFFYVAKASTRERNLGLGMSRRSVGPAGAGNHHPCVKPIALMRHLCRLVTPVGGLVLDPFVGSGSTGAAAILEGFAFTGIDQDSGYLEIARARIEWAATRQSEDRCA